MFNTKFTQNRNDIVSGRDVTIKRVESEASMMLITYIIRDFVCNLE
jgi:hypothetical protein